MTDRIKLAEAMGWRRINNEDPYWWPPKELIPKGALAYDYVGFDQLPDPFTDANDDYAVLEWYRKKYGTPSLEADNLEMYLPLAFNYQIGDYARAALMVIDD